MASLLLNIAVIVYKPDTKVCGSRIISLPDPNKPLCISDVDTMQSGSIKPSSIFCTNVNNNSWLAVVIAWSVDELLKASCGV